MAVQRETVLLCAGHELLFDALYSYLLTFSHISDLLSTYCLNICLEKLLLKEEF